MKLIAKKSHRQALIFVFFLTFTILENVAAIDIQRLRTLVLQGNYKEAIKEGEKLIALASGPEGLDELYYLLGISYLKDENYLRASDIFEIIIEEYPKSTLLEQAMLGLGDTYFLREKYINANQIYEKLLSSLQDNKIRPIIYERLARCYIKLGDSQQAENYKRKLQGEFPEYARLNHLLKDLINEGFFTVQVGAFSKKQNAENLVKRLIQEGYSAYLEEIEKEGVPFRVRVGKYKLRAEAEGVARKLLSLGYPAKIIP